MRIKANDMYWCDVLKRQFKLPSYKFQSDKKKISMGSKHILGELLRIYYQHDENI
jgi:hypothetical protein